MKQPDFWYEPPGALARALGPFSGIWKVGAKFRMRRGALNRMEIPVICVGNLSVGGTGKTPLAVALAERLTKASRETHIVSRGYGGSAVGPLRVDPGRHSARQVGDEPLLLAAFAPTWISRDRFAGAKLAAEAGANAILLDDGHQNFSMAPDLSIVVVDAVRGFGNGKVVPAGPLREDIGPGLERADVVVAVGSREARNSFRRKWKEKISVPLVSAELQVLETGMDWSELPVLAFAGIGHPEKFFRTLRDAGANVAATEALDDHQPLPDALLQRLDAKAKSLGAQLVTTEKDAVRLTSAWRRRVLTLPVRMKLSDWTAIDRNLTRLGLLPSQ
ncbi:MAG: tetraacyldisaccharide 4'-kinase [Albidovulum sp.]|nr:tetraacyldisaccharide 4'-kinase [Albidovulum sp.]MDE0533267.1 tetraacyldisaccharide 4'-kinase [Albidovulum sp.]